MMAMMNAARRPGSKLDKDGCLKGETRCSGVMAVGVSWRMVYSFDPLALVSRGVESDPRSPVSGTFG